MNVSYQEILTEYKAKHAELTYTTICQQLAIKKLEEKVTQLEAELQTSKDNEDAERRRAEELQSLLDEKESNL
jgi:Skp family chaperone for outer membrane proteins